MNRPAMPIKLRDGFAAHPGAWLGAEIVEPAGLSVTALAGRMRVTRQAGSNLLGGNAVLSAEMAIRFERAFGLKAGRRMQSADALAQESDIVVNTA